MKIIAQDGTRRLVALDDGTDNGYVTDGATVFPTAPLVSLIARGDWEEYTGPQDVQTPNA